MTALHCCVLREVFKQKGDAVQMTCIITRIKSLIQFHGGTQ